MNVNELILGKKFNDAEKMGSSNTVIITENRINRSFLHKKMLHMFSVILLLAIVLTVTFLIIRDTASKEFMFIPYENEVSSNTNKLLNTAELGNDSLRIIRYMNNFFIVNRGSAPTAVYYDTFEYNDKTIMFVTLKTNRWQQIIASKNAIHKICLTESNDDYSFIDEIYYCQDGAEPIFKNRYGGNLAKETIEHTINKSVLLYEK